MGEKCICDILFTIYINVYIYEFSETAQKTVLTNTGFVKAHTLVISICTYIL
jgi:hypothetical protein